MGQVAPDRAGGVAGNLRSATGLVCFVSHALRTFAGHSFYEPQSQLTDHLLIVVCVPSCCVLFRRRKKSRAAKAHHSTEDKQWDQHDRPAPIQEMAPAYSTGNTGRSTAQHIGQKHYDAPQTAPQYATPNNTSHYDAPQAAPQYSTWNSTGQSQARMATNQYNTEGAAGQSHSIYNSN